MIPLLDSPGLPWGCNQWEGQLGEKIQDGIIHMSGDWCWLLASVLLFFSTCSLILQKLEQLDPLPDIAYIRTTFQEGKGRSYKPHET